MVHKTKQNKVQESKKKEKKRRIFFVLSVVYGTYEFGINEEKLVREHSRIHHSFFRALFSSRFLIHREEKIQRAAKKR